jgi:hypothetical protein
MNDYIFINITPFGPKSLNSLTMATVITTHTFINIIPQCPTNQPTKLLTLAYYVHGFVAFTKYCIRVMKLRRMRWAECVARLGEMRDA